MHDMTPMQLADLGIKDVKTFTDLLEDHVIMMDDKKYAPRYVSGQIKAAKSWIRHLDVQVQRKIRISNIHIKLTLVNESSKRTENI